MLKPTAHGTTAWAEDQPFLVPPFAIARTADNWLSRLRSMLIVGGIGPIWHISLPRDQQLQPCTEEDLVQAQLSLRACPLFLARCDLRIKHQQLPPAPFTQDAPLVDCRFQNFIGI
jgi:hypothetical protein